jgi:hypothetical protein
MFKDFKSGGYNLESTGVSGERLISLILLIAIALEPNLDAYNNLGNLLTHDAERTVRLRVAQESGTPAEFL